MISWIIGGRISGSGAGGGGGGGGDGEGEGVGARSSLRLMMISSRMISRLF